MNSPQRDDKEDLKGLYDLVIPLGTPITVIKEMVEEFDLDLVRRDAKIDMKDTVGEVVDREVLVLRGDIETVMKAKDYLSIAVERRLKTLEEGDPAREERLRKAYEERLKEQAEDRKREREAAEEEEQDIDKP